MISQFIEQVQILMEIQQIKLIEAENFIKTAKNSKYDWLSSRKVTLVILSFKHEYKIRQALVKISLDQQIDILRKLMKWLTDHPTTDVIKIPDLTLDLINAAIMFNLVTEANFSRKTSFRNSLRRLSNSWNRIAPAHGPVEKARSVTFKDQPMIYKIYK